MTNSNDPKLTPYEAIALSAAEVLPEALFKDILLRAKERVHPDMLGHDWNNAETALLTYLSTQQAKAPARPLGSEEREI